MLNSIDTTNVSTFNINTYTINTANTSTFSISTFKTSTSNTKTSSTNISGTRTPNIITQIQISGQKKIIKLLEKDASKVVISEKFVISNILEEILSNIQIFNSCFVDKIKNPNTHKSYKKSCLVLQTGDDKNKKFKLM